MKKLLCVLMAVMMIISSMAVIGASAADGYLAENPINDSFASYDEFMTENGEKKIYGYTPDFLYEKTGIVDWSQLDLYTEKMGIPVRVTGSELSLAEADMNSYLKRVTNSFFLGDKLYNEEYAVALVNFIGKLVYPDFKTVDKVFEANTTPNEYDFYETVAKKSLLGEVIQKNWIDAGVDFKPFLTAFGVDLKDVVNSDFAKGVPVAKALIQGAVNTLIAYGPLEYAVRMLETLSVSYSSNLYEAATSLFSMKIAAGKPVRGSNGKITGRTNYSVAELQSVQGLLTYAFDGIFDCDFFKFPDARISVSSDSCERLLFLMLYFAVNYNYNYNASFVDSLAGKLSDFILGGGRYSAAGYSYHEAVDVVEKISMMIDIIFKGDISDEAVAMLDELNQTNLDSVKDDVGTQVTSWFSKLLRKIADYFDYLFKLFTGEIKYGESLFD